MSITAETQVETRQQGSNIWWGSTQINRIRGFAIINAVAQIYHFDIAIRIGTDPRQYRYCNRATTIVFVGFVIGMPAGVFANGIDVDGNGIVR